MKVLAHVWCFIVDMSLRIMNVYEPLIQNTESVYTRVMEAQLLFVSLKLKFSDSFVVLALSIN